uniref:Probable membrane transporter protein n=1 Tax=Desulfatirhabdium butyrativorans TaxID=340467 RepID=A0A7C4W097_9BACT
MTQTTKSFIVLGILAALLLTPLILPDTAFADKLTDAIAKTPVGTGKGQIDPKAAPGYLGIPGGPNVNFIVAFLWAVWVGWIFSTVGAFGGIMAGVGHISVFGLGTYAATFKDTSPVLNKVITDSIRVSNQFLVGMSALISSINYYKMGRLVVPLGIALAIGSMGGSYLVPLLTAGKVSFKAYQGYFGLFVLLLGCWMLYETTPAGAAKKKAAKAAADAFEKVMKEKKAGANVDTRELGVKIVEFSASRVRFTFYGVEFHFNPLFPVIGGFVIAAVASFIGVGGGFLLVPFLTSVSGLPMYLSAGTSAFAVLIGMITSIFSYIQQGTIVHWSLIGLEMAGIVAGSILGPYTSKYLPDKALKILFIVLAFVTGIDYFMKGFFGVKLLPGG